MPSPSDQTGAVRVSIVTPSYQSSAWLRLCIASVADQNVQAEHIVQDAGSTDGTLDWLPGEGRVRCFVQQDQGMYDAINRALRHANGEILAYLNCDEQYLPGALRQVDEFFQTHPRVGVLFGDVVVVDREGGYLGHRKMQTPLKYHTWTCHLSTLSCATFFRRELFFDRGLVFNPELRDAGDGEWMVRLLKARVAMAVLGEFTSVFTHTGTNMSAGENARRENRELRLSAPRLARGLRPAIIIGHRLRRLWGGMYRQRPFAYQIFTLANPNQRQRFEVARPRSRLTT